MHLVARAVVSYSAYMYRKDDAPSRSSILLSSKEYNSTEELKNRARIREERRKNLLRCSKADRKKTARRKISKVYRKLEEKLKID